MSSTMTQDKDVLKITFEQTEVLNEMFFKLQPRLEIEPTEDYHLTNREYVDKAIGDINNSH